MMSPVPPRRLPAAERMSRYGNPTLVTTAVLALALVCSLVAGCALGGASIPFSKAIHFLGAALLRGEITPDEVTGYQIVWQIRAPRVLLAALVGAALAASGAAMQSVVRNVLADPYILGVSAGASVGAVSITIALGGFSTLGLAALAASSSAFLVMAGAFAGALAASALVWITAHGRGGGVSPVRLVLTGVVIAAGFQALMSVLIYAIPDTESTATVLFWTMGSFGAAGWGTLGPAAALILMSIATLYWRSTILDVLSQGDETATSLGVDPVRSRRFLFLVISLAAAAATATSGAIGFVGLVVPHITRMIVGASHRRVLLVSPLLGAVLMVWVDIVARSVFAPRELPISAITALFGVPAFIALLRHRGRVLGA